MCLHSVPQPHLYEAGVLPPGVCSVRCVWYVTKEPSEEEEEEEVAEGGE